MVKRGARLTYFLVEFRSVASQVCGTLLYVLGPRICEVSSNHYRRKTYN